MTSPLMLLYVRSVFKGFVGSKKMKIKHLALRVVWASLLVRARAQKEDKK